VLLKLRPYETQAGAADKAYEYCVHRMVQALERGLSEKEMAEEMKICADEFARVPVDRSKRKPLVSVVGEIYVRSHTFANDNIVRQLESLGAEVNLAGFAEWLYYTNYTRKKMALRWSDYKLYLQNILKNQIQHKIERSFAGPLEAVFGHLAEGNIKDVIDAAAPYMHESFEGEAVLSIGKIVEMHHHQAAGAVNVMPFTCMPSTIVSAIARQITRDFAGMPILNISYDGQQDPTLQTRLEAFMHQVNSYHKTVTQTAIEIH